MAKRKTVSRIRTGSSQKLRYGWIPDLPDHRDLLYGAVRPVTLEIPQHVDLRSMCSPVENQGNLGSCTGNALAGALEFLEQKDRVPFVDVSRLFIYYNERTLEGSVKSDSGAMIRDGIKTLRHQGVCSEKKWPYIISKFAMKPSPACYKEALDHQITRTIAFSPSTKCGDALLKDFRSSSDLRCTKVSSRRKLRRPVSFGCHN